MDERKGRTLAFLAATLSIAVLVAAGIYAKDQIREWLLEECWIRDLKSPQEDTRLRALEALGEARSTRGVPYLIRLLSEQKRERIWHWGSSGSIIACGRGGSSIRSVPTESGRGFTPIAYAIFRMGEAARPAVSKALEAEERELQKRVEKQGSWTSTSLDFFSLLCEITWAWKSPECKVKRVDYGQSP